MQDLHDLLLEEEQHTEVLADIDPIEHLRRLLNDGVEWPVALLKSMALWTVPVETVGGRQFSYFIGGEAFDWLLLAERLCQEVGEFIPADEMEELLFTGRFPASFDDSQVKELLGVHKRRGYLNYYYGVVVEEALQMAVEREVHKRKLSNGNQYEGDYSDEVFEKIYREPREALMEEFRQEGSYDSLEVMSVTQLKEFTYWLFKYRIKTSDKAKIASDTKKGLDALLEMAMPKHPVIKIS
ncbi:MAG: hypothetical protein O2821_06615 [Chloroflexi bacterium]|nr:hypothetical protein [Chloroflexota bacterium]MDA1226426.1 hypothetical protein [Chloroflexota bacterium]